MKEKNNDVDWISVSDYAKNVGKSTQWVYNQIRDGRLKALQFGRGKYRGLLVYVGNE